MKPATLEFLKSRFSGYYRAGLRNIPPSLEQREWGFVFFDTSTDMRMRRHMAFNSRQEVAIYLKTMVPAHVYYSTAYYDFPSAGSMNDKHWTGADLIFDLDADHLVRGVPYDTMLERVKEETKKMLAILIDELGFRTQDIELVFSGGRGYHVHVRDIAVRGWGSAERRELVDYLCAVGLDPKRILGRPDSHLPGWPARYRAALGEHLHWIRSMEEGEGVAYLRSLKGIGEKSPAAPEFYAGIGRYLDLLKDPESTISLKDRVLRAIVREDGELVCRVREQAALPDEPVTTDIKRLIRMPTSLHGGSGLRVMTVSIDELEQFDPLVEAVVFGEEPVAVDVAFPLKVPMLGNEFGLQKGRNTVPEAVAVFLCCRGIAELSER